MGFTTFCGAEIPKAAEHLLRRKKTWAFSDVLERKIKNKEYVGDYLFLIDNGEVGYIYCECPVGNEVYIEYCEIDPKIDVSTRFRITLEAREQVPKFLEDKGLVIKKYMRLHYTNLQLKTKYGLKLVPVLLSISDFEKIDPVYKNVEFAAWFNYNITEILQQIVDRYYHVFKLPIVLWLPFMPDTPAIGTTLVEKEDIMVVLEFNMLLGYVKKNEDLRGTIYHEILHHLDEIKKSTLRLLEFHADELKHLKEKIKSKVVRHFWDKSPERDIKNMMYDIVVNLSLRGIAPPDIIGAMMPSYVKNAYAEKNMLLGESDEITRYSSLEQFFFLTDTVFIPYSLTEAFGPIIFTNPKSALHEQSVMKEISSLVEFWENIVIEKLNPYTKELVLEFFNRYCNCLAHITVSEKKEGSGFYEEEYFYMPEDVIEHLVHFYVEAMKLLGEEGKINDFDQRLRYVIEDRTYLKEHGIKMPKCKKCSRTYPVNFKFCPICSINLN